MADSFEKRARERRKLMRRREKAERKRDRDETKTGEPEVLTPEHWFGEDEEAAPEGSDAPKPGEEPA